jgi:ribonuclease HI
MPWVRRLLRGQRVYAKVDQDGQLEVADGRVAVVYRLSAGAKIYRANPKNLNVTGEPGDEALITAPEVDAAALEPTERVPTPQNGTATPPPADLPEGTLIIYTDGACTGNPGPAGIGVVILDGDERKEVSEYLGEGTNNIAELTAILRALELADPSRVVAIHTDSSYSIGLLTKNWKAKANKELVAELRELASTFKDLRFVKVKGHAGIPENERADELATGAIADRPR